MGLFNKKEVAEIQKLKSENRQLRLKVQELENQLQKKAQNSERFKLNKQREEQQRQEELFFNETWISQYYQNLGKYYKLKNTIFYRNEQGVFYCLENIFKGKAKWNSQKYIIVPQIRIVDFINPLTFDAITEKSEFDDDLLDDLLYNRYVLGEVTSKHVDFLICEHIPKGRNSEYKPVLAIEVHGIYHQTKEEVKRNDRFKQALFNSLGIKLLVLELYEQIVSLGAYTDELEQKIANILR
jgi:hypothetical protein